MSTEEKDRRIQEQLSRLLDYNAPAVTMREAQQCGEQIAISIRAAPSTPKRRVKGLVPALAWMLGLLVLGALGLGIFVGVSGTAATRTGPPPFSLKLSDHLVLDQNRVVAGHSVNGNLVVYNHGKAFKVYTGCLPMQGSLNRGSFHQQVPSDLMLCATQRVIVHGTTRLPFTVDTSYGACAQSGPVTATFPRCLGSGKIPPLPSGTYLVKLLWEGPKSVPSPDEVALTLTG